METPILTRFKDNSSTGAWVRASVNYAVHLPYEPQSQTYLYNNYLISLALPREAREFRFFNGLHECLGNLSCIEAQGVSEANPKPMTGFLAKSRDKGARTERAIVRTLQALGAARSVQEQV